MNKQLINYLSRLEELSLLETEEINREELTDELNEIYESAHDIFVDCEMNEYYTNNRMKCSKWLIRTMFSLIVSIWMRMRMNTIVAL